MKGVLKHSWLKLIILLIGLSVAAQSALASTFVLPADDDLIVSARAIITGKVLSIESALDEQQDRIYTYITVKVQEVLKGKIYDRRIVLKEMGGQVGNRGFNLYGNPQFAVDERVLLYLDTWKDGSLRTHQLFLGKFSIVKDEATGHEFVVRSVPDDRVTVLRGQPQEGFTATDRMELKSYMNMVRTRLEINRDRSREFLDTYYRDVPMLKQPGEIGRAHV